MTRPLLLSFGLLVTLSLAGSISAFLHSTRVGSIAWSNAVIYSRFTLKSPRGYRPFQLSNEDPHASTEEATAENSDLLLDPDIAGKFKILTCSSTACAAKRKSLNIDQYSTFSAFYTRAKERAPAVRVEECPCLGACKKAPCVGIEHDDFEGSVALDGMTESEFSERVFHGILFDEDADRIWSAVENAIQLMAQEEE
jgi:hypothetical protein